MVDVYEVQIVQNEETGIVEHEGWRLDGKLHRVGAPALVWRDAHTGVAYIEQWNTNGFLDRVEGPARIHRDRATGAVTEEAYFRRGVPSASQAMTTTPNDPAP